MLREALSQSRKKSIRAIVEELGYSFKLDDGAILDLLKAFPLYKRGFDRKASNIMVKNQEEVEITVFDYKYSTYSPGNLKLADEYPRMQTVMLLKPKTFKLPEIKMYSGQKNPGIGKEAFDYFNKLLSMCIESNEHGMLIYEDQIKHPPEDIRTIIMQRLRLFELITKNPNE